MIPPSAGILGNPFTEGRSASYFNDANWEIMTTMFGSCIRRWLPMTICGALIGIGSNAQAVVLTFSEPDFQWLSQGGGGTPNHVWTAGDFWEQTFNGTGLGAAASLQLDLEIDDNILNGLAFVDFDVLVNSTTVGSFTVNEGEMGMQIYNFTFSPIAGPNFTIKMLETNTVPSGQGSVSMAVDGDSTATLNAVPEPATVAVLGLGALALMRRRRSTKS